MGWTVRVCHSMDKGFLGRHAGKCLLEMFISEYGRFVCVRDGKGLLESPSSSKRRVGDSNNLQPSRNY